MKNLFNFYNELKRRNVIKAGISYCIVSWVILQVTALLSGILNAPVWLSQTLLITLLVLLPIWLLISWYYEITPEGIQRTKNVGKEKSIRQQTSIQLNKIIILFLAVAVALLFVDRFRIQKKQVESTANVAIDQRGQNSIVVLPFTDLSPNKDQEYFADGLAEELLNSLTKIPELRVTSRTSAFSFKNTQTDIPTIAQKLGVNYILEGSVRKSDSVVRITVQLIDTRKDKNVWSKIWDHKLKDIFEVQNLIAKAISDNLEISLMSNSIPKATVVNPEAYALYLESKFWFQKYSDYEINQRRADSLIELSLQIDSTYAPSWVLRSGIYRMQSAFNLGPLTVDEGYKKAKEAAEKSISLDSKEAQGYRLLSLIALEHHWDFQKAAHFNEKAIELNPYNADIVAHAANLNLILGNEKEAIRLNKQSVTLDPVNVNSLYNLSVTYYYLGMFEEAIPPMRKSLALEHEQYGAHYILSLIYLKLNRLAEAASEIQAEPDEICSAQVSAMLFWAQGNKNKARESLQILLDSQEPGFDHMIAQIYAFWGDIDKAFLWLDKAYENHVFELVELKYDPFLKSLHKDARWEPFLKKMNLI